MTTYEERIDQLEAAVEELRRELHAPQDTEMPAPSERISRRKLLSVGGTGLAALTLLGATPSPAAAANGSGLVLGQDNSATGTTSLSGSVPTAPALRASNYYGGPFDNYSDAVQAYAYGAGLAGVYGRNDAGGGSALVGYSVNGLGGSFTGGQAAIQLQPARSAGAPTSGTHQQGEILVDANGTPYRCATAGSPGTWVPMIALVPFPNPRRVFSQTMTNGQVAGPIDATVTTSAAPSGLPRGAQAAWAAVMSYSAGVLTIYPDGTADTGIGNWTSTANGPLNLTYMMVPVSSAGKFWIHAYFTSAVYVDVWGYLM